MTDPIANAKPLLIEIGTEELPAGSVTGMAQHLASHLHQSLSDGQFNPGKAQVFSTPRRLAVLFDNVDGAQPEQNIERRGPSVAAGFDDAGEPTKALLGFARSCQVEVTQLQRIETPKGEWLVYRDLKPGLSLADSLQSMLDDALRQMPMPKRMRWADLEHEFLRPVHWLTVLYGSAVLPLTAFGCLAGNMTRGHRFHAPDALAIPGAIDYAEVLSTQGYVMADASIRRQKILDEVAAVETQLNGTAVKDAALVDEITSLVEWPVAIAGRFDESYLDIPDEALIQTMQENQRYFAVRDSAGALMPWFITIANLESSNPDSVRAGNERVVHPRFADTMFFWQRDLDKPLEEHREALKQIVFQEKLGTVFEKTERLARLSAELAPVTGADADTCVEAARLCKCDLVTELVTELAKMQGLAGSYYYQRQQGVSGDDAVACALREHYLPARSGGDLPSQPAAQALALAERIDTLIGIFGVGLKPTGTKDPFALRRAALGLLRIIIEKELDLDLADVFQTSMHAYEGRLSASDMPRPVTEFVHDRLRQYFLDDGIAVDVVDAVMALPNSKPLDIARRVAAVDAFRGSDAAPALAAANKRIGNLLKKNPVEDSGYDSSLLSEAAEKALAEQLDSLSAQVESRYQQQQYREVLETTAALRAPVDAFFEDVMVMVDDDAVRANRLQLLRSVQQLCSRVADISRLQG